MSTPPLPLRRAFFGALSPIGILALALVTGATSLPGQSPAALTVIRDASWDGSFSPVDFQRARSPAKTARLTNVSIRARAGSATDTLIAGAVVQGTGTLPMLVRAIGPGLARFGVADVLRAPKLEIFRGATLAAETSILNTGVPATSAYVGAFPALDRDNGLAPGDAALVGQASAGMLTAHCSAANGAPGVALLEFYDAADAPAATSAHFVNLSSRAQVAAGDGLIVIGFVIAGEGNLTLLFRGVGATLEQFGVTDTLRDPVIELYSGNTRIAANDNWRSGAPDAVGRVEDAQLAVGAFALTSANDAALVATLPAGAYTLQVRGASGQGGVALAELHEVNLGDFDAAQATNAVGLDLYRELLKTNPGGNLIISPYSIESALALAYAGAEGGTREEMARVLRLPADNTPLQSSFAGLRRALEKTAEDSKATADTRTRAGVRTAPIEWSAANRLFGQFDYDFRAPFLTLMRDGFAAPFEPLDFFHAAESARLTINSWVENQTHDKIRDLIPMGGVATDTALVLVNALYLNAPWDVPFQKNNTLSLAFHPTPSTSRDVPTMQRTGFLGYAAETGFTVVTLDYLGGGLQLVIALPDAGRSPAEVVAALTSAHFARWSKLGDTGRRSVALYLPKFRTEGKTIPLGDALQALGMRQAFDKPEGSANFEGIAPRKITPFGEEYLAVSKVFHQTFVALDEEGTEAAAATAVVISVVTTSITVQPEPTVVRVDRPFLFAIQHRASGTCLFLGQVTNPQ